MPVETRFSAPVQTRPGSHPASCTMGTESFIGVKTAGPWRWPLTPFYCSGQERVELYLYSPCVPYGLYRASVPVQRAHFIFFFVSSRIIYINYMFHTPDYRVTLTQILQLICEYFCMLELWSVTTLFHQRKNTNWSIWFIVRKVWRIVLVELSTALSYLCQIGENRENLIFLCSK